jgi:hypothetical protein
VLPDTVFQEIFVFRSVETTSKLQAKHVMTEILRMETDAVQLVLFNLAITACLQVQKVSAVLVLVVFLTVPLAHTVPVFHVLLAHLDIVYQETPAFKFVEITLKRQVKVVMMETPSAETGAVQLAPFKQDITAKL